MIEDYLFQQDPEYKKIFRDLCERLHSNIRNKTTDKGEQPFQIPVREYASKEVYEEDLTVLKKMPVALGPISLLDDPKDYFTRNIYGVPVVALRDRENQIRVLSNICLHRGACILPTHEHGKELKYLKCPYHGWTYNHEGELLHIPGMEQGMSGCKKEDFQMRSYPYVIHGGILWTSFDQSSDNPQEELEKNFQEVGSELDKMGLNDFAMMKEFVFDGEFNWKLAVESFLEVYHFQYAHKKTLTQFKHHNICLMDWFGNNSRIVVPLNSISEQMEKTEDQWKLLDSTNIMYFLFPNNLLLLFDDHFGWLNIIPKNHKQTRYTYTTFISRGDHDEAAMKRFQSNAMGLEIIVQEDFEVCATVQEGLHSQAFENFRYTQFEEVIHRFHKSLQKERKSS